MDDSRPPLATRGTRAVLVAVPALFVAVFFGWPVAAIIARGFGVGAIADVLGDHGVRSVLWFTLWQAAISTLLAVVAGLAPAYVLARYRFPGRRVLLALVTVPFVLPTVVVGSAFLAVLPASWHRTATAVVLAHVWVNLAVVVRTVGASVSQLDPGLADAAATLGASPWRVLRHVTLPLLRPAVVASASVVFLFCFTSFGIVRVLGGPSRPTLEVEIWRRTTQLLDLRTAAVLALTQLVLVAGLVAWWTRTQARAAVAATVRPHGRLTVTRGWAGAGVTAVAALTALVVVVPLAVMVQRSFRPGGADATAAWSAVWSGAPQGTGGAPALVSHPLATVGTSLRIALAASLLGTAMGGLAACAVAYTRRAGRWLDTGLMLPLGTSAVTVGFGLLITFDAPPLDLRASPWMIPLGHSLVALPFVVRVVLPALQSVPPGLRDAAATLGASPLQVWREVDLPVLRRALGAGAGFAFAVSIGEFGATSFLTRTGNVTAPIAIARLLQRPSAFNLAQAFALATLLAVLTLVVILAVDRLRGERGASF